MLPKRGAYLKRKVIMGKLNGCIFLLKMMAYKNIIEKY